MPVYKYKALTKKGEYIGNTYNAGSKDEVIEMLRNRNYYPILIKKSNTWKFFCRSIPTKDLEIFCRQFYTMFHAGVNIVKCLTAIQMYTTNKKMGMILKNVQEGIEKGRTFSKSLADEKIFPQFFINMVEAGEMSGKLDMIMKRMAIHYEKENKLRRKIESAMVYPLILCVTSILVVIFLLTYVLPTFIILFQDAHVQLPLSTRILLKISTLCTRYGYEFFLAFLFLLCGIYYIGKDDRIKQFLDQLKFEIPAVKDMVKKIVSIRFSRTFSILLASGAPLITSLESTKKVIGNRFVENRMNIVVQRVTKGENLTNSVNKMGVFLPIVISMIEIGEESGTLDNMLDQTADFLDEEMDKTIQKMLPMIEPLFILFMAGIVGFIVLAMMMPVFNMMDTIS
ncbi:type II secretion system F family protein [Marinisporobacter balticus]|uniref:Type II secretion system protein F (GspF) n=1 Tax=Marinisporobacter balticus TaxID=2018667 RepID=A0A4R2L0U0_9FIRM|nr:type II secretion system F family protein [Marinisporobacter balticus]TCO79172.1 type II secretion system protein F (GspF) [Marinisporobacter balticus]